MTTIAILYGTTEGQTGKIAQRLGAAVRAHGARADVLHVAELPDDFDVAKYDGVIAGASIHEGRHQRYVMRWLKAHRAQLERLPSAWFTVCLAIQSKNAKERQEAEAFPRQIPEKTGWRPSVMTVFAGALMYTKYSWLKRMVLKQIAKHEGGSTDTSRDHEYTNWAEVDAFAEAFLVRLDESAAMKRRAARTSRPRAREGAAIRP
jgi:menaquinone-dependent protoporphyrinogen oxidase